MPSHDIIDQRSLAFGRAIADELVRQPALLSRARATATRWMTSCSPRVRPALQEWLVAIDAGPVRVIAILTGEDEPSTRLRQSNPFAGVLSDERRLKILLQYHEPAAA